MIRTTGLSRFGRPKNYLGTARILLLLLLPLCLAVGCAGQPHYRVLVNSLAGEEVKTISSRYVLLPQDKNLPPGDLQFEEFARQIDIALKAKGFIPVANLEEADQAIFLGYGISDPQQQIGTTTTPVYDHIGYARAPFYRGYRPRMGMYTGMGMGYGSPVYGISGYTTDTYTYTTFTRRLTLSSLAVIHGDKAESGVEPGMKPGAEPGPKRGEKAGVKPGADPGAQLGPTLGPTLGEELWKVTATSTGNSGDLRTVFPALVSAVKRFIAVDSGHGVDLKIEVQNPSNILE